MMRDLLDGEDIPVLIRRPGGLDLPHLLVAGPREVVVRDSDAERARELVVSHFRAGDDDADAGAGGDDEAEGAPGA